MDEISTDFVLLNWAVSLIARLFGIVKLKTYLLLSHWHCMKIVNEVK